MINKDVWKKVFIGFLPICFIVLNILLAIYLVALIIPDNFDPITAEKIGYGIIAGIIALSLLAILLMKYSDVEKEALLVRHEVDRHVIEKLEKELERLRKDD